MKKTRLLKKRKITSFQKKYDRKEFNKIKNQGLSLKTSKGNVNLRIHNEIVKKEYKKPKIKTYNIKDINTGIAVCFPENCDEAFIDFKVIERYPTDWKEYGRIYKPQKNRIYEFINEISYGKSVKYRLTYFKDTAIRYADTTTSDPNFDFSENPPELYVFNQEKSTVYLFSLERFTGAGYYKIFKKENEEKEKCIKSGLINNNIVSYSEPILDNFNYCLYRAEVYDDLGNKYDTNLMRSFINHDYKRKEKKILSDEEGKFIEVTNEKYFKIEYIDTNQEKVDIFEIEVNDNKKVYLPKETILKNYRIFIEGFSGDKSVSYATGNISLVEPRKITDVKISTNKKLQNIIEWNYQGKIDSFLVIAKDFDNIRIIEKLSHRKINNKHIYCIDADIAKRNTKTEYVINGMDEFNKIVAKERITYGRE